MTEHRDGFAPESHRLPVFRRTPCANPGNSPLYRKTRLECQQEIFFLFVPGTCKGARSALHRGRKPDHLPGDQMGISASWRRQTEIKVDVLDRVLQVTRDQVPVVSVKIAFVLHLSSTCSIKPLQLQLGSCS